MEKVLSVLENIGRYLLLIRPIDVLDMAIIAYLVYRFFFAEDLDDFDDDLYFDDDDDDLEDFFEEDEEAVPAAKAEG